MSTCRGFIKFVDRERRFGFLCQLAGPDRWFHLHELADELRDDETIEARQVEFDLAPSTNGRPDKAVHVRPLNA